MWREGGRATKEIPRYLIATSFSALWRLSRAKREISRGFRGRVGGRDGGSYCELKAQRTCGSYPTALAVPSFLSHPSRRGSDGAFYTSGGLATEKGAGFVAKRSFNHSSTSGSDDKEVVHQWARNEGGGGSRAEKHCFPLHCKRAAPLCSSRIAVVSITRLSQW